MTYKPPTARCHSTVPVSLPTAFGPSDLAALIVRFEGLLDRFEELLADVDGDYDEPFDETSDPESDADPEE